MSLTTSLTRLLGAFDSLSSTALHPFLMRKALQVSVPLLYSPLWEVRAVVFSPAKLRWPGDSASWSQVNTRFPPSSYSADEHLTLRILPEFLLKSYITVPGHNISQWKEQLTIARDAFSTTNATQKSLPSPQIPLTVPIGAGFLGWSMDAQSASAQQSQDNIPSNPFLQAALDSHLRAIWLSFGKDLKKWIDVVRAHDKATAEKHGKGDKTLIFVQVNHVEEAVVAVRDWGVDVVSLQGTTQSFLVSLISSTHGDEPVST